MRWAKSNAITEAAGGDFTFWTQAGAPGAGSNTGTALAGTAPTSSTAGALGPISGPTDGRRLWLYDAEGTISGQAGTIMILDRLLQVPGIDHTSTSTQTVTGTTTVPRYTTGVGVFAFLEVTSALGAGSQTVSLSYTDDEGNTGQTSPAFSITASAAANRLAHAIPFLPLLAGDRGMRAVASLTFVGALGSGTSCLVLAKHLCSIWCPGAGQKGSEPLLDLGGPVEVESDAALMARVMYSTTTDSAIFGKMRLAQVAAPT